MAVNTKEDKNIIFYSANSLLPNIQTLNKNARNILKRSDIEDIHDVRVSSRRIRTVLNIFTEYFPNKKIKTWQKEIRSITKSFGGARDLDVQMDLIDEIYKAAADNKIRSGLRRIRLRLNKNANRSKKQLRIPPR